MCDSINGIDGAICLDRERALEFTLRKALKFLLDFHISDNLAELWKVAFPLTGEIFILIQNTIEYFVPQGSNIDFVQISNNIINGFICSYIIIINDVPKIPILFIINVVD